MTDQERIEELERQVKELKEGPDWKKALEDISKALPPAPIPIYVPIPYYPHYYYPSWPRPYWITYTTSPNLVTTSGCANPTG